MKAAALEICFGKAEPSRSLLHSHIAHQKDLVDSSFQGSNIAFPATDEEIAAFGEFIKKGAKTLSETEIQRLLETLKQPPK